MWTFRRRSGRPAGASHRTAPPPGRGRAPRSPKTAWRPRPPRPRMSLLLVSPQRLVVHIVLCDQWRGELVLEPVGQLDDVAAVIRLTLLRSHPGQRLLGPVQTVLRVLVGRLGHRGVDLALADRVELL